MYNTTLLYMSDWVTTRSVLVSQANQSECGLASYTGGTFSFWKAVWWCPSICVQYLHCQSYQPYHWNTCTCIPTRSVLVSEANQSECAWVSLVHRWYFCPLVTQALLLQRGWKWKALQWLLAGLAGHPSSHSLLPHERWKGSEWIGAKTWVGHSCTVKSYKSA